MREVRFSTPRQSYRHHEDLAPIDGVSQLFVLPAFPAFVPRGITYACHKRPDCVAAQLDKVLSTHMGKRSMYLMSSLLLHTYYIAAAPSLMRPSDVWASNPRERRAGKNVDLRPITSQLGVCLSSATLLPSPLWHSTYVRVVGFHSLGLFGARSARPS